MRLIESKVEYLPQEKGLEGVYKQIEKCARTCYKSEDKITDTSAKSFVERMINSKHFAMLEHGTIYLKRSVDCTDIECLDFMHKYEMNPHSKVDFETGIMLVTTNYRVIIENHWEDDLKYICDPTEYHEKRYTFKFTTDRGVMGELTRHRVFSFAIESTRYCNYSKDKFDRQISFITPNWDMLDKCQEIWINYLAQCEETYLKLLSEGWTPQQARQMLPNALKTEICMTGFESDWDRLFDIRYYESTGKVHPNMKDLMTKTINLINHEKIFSKIYN